MRNEIGRKVDEFRLEAEKLISRNRRSATDNSTRDMSSDDDLNVIQEAISAGIEETIEELETAFSDLSELTEEKIARHPLATMAVVFAIGVLIGRLSKTQE